MDRPSDNPAWRVLAEFDFFPGPGAERLAEDRILRAVRELGVAPRSLEQIKTAAVFAAQDACGHVCGHRPGSSASIRVLVRDKGSPRGGEVAEAQITGQGAEESASKAERGWGFFLIKRASDRPPAGTDALHCTIEVYLYPEGIGPPR